MDFKTYHFAIIHYGLTYLLKLFSIVLKLCADVAFNV